VTRHRVPLTGGGELVKVSSEYIGVRLYPLFCMSFSISFQNIRKKFSYMTSFFRLFFVCYSFTVLLSDLDVRRTPSDVDVLHDPPVTGGSKYLK
jgi:hypothetical protein